MTEFSFLSVPMLLWSTHTDESLGWGRREDWFVVPFVSRVGTGVVGSLMTDSERTKVVNKYLAGGFLPPEEEPTSNCFSRHHQMTFQSHGKR
jgi:hypothetical protein